MLGQGVVESGDVEGALRGPVVNGPAHKQRLHNRVGTLQLQPLELLRCDSHLERHLFFRDRDGIPSWPWAVVEVGVHPFMVSLSVVLRQHIDLKGW